MNNPEVQFIRSGMATFRDRSFSVRYLSDFHTFHLHQYHGKMRLGKETFPLSPGTVTLSPQGQSSYYDLDYPGNHLFLHFQTEGESIGAGGVIPDPDAFYARQLNRILSYVRSSPRNRWVTGAIEAATEEMLCRYVAEQTGCVSTATVDCVARAHDLLEERFADVVTIPEVAAVVGMSPNYLAQLFRERYGKTMKRALMEIRLDRAKYLLRNTDLLVSQVGARSGIPDPQYFNKLFRREGGCSPGRFRDGGQ